MQPIWLLINLAFYPGMRNPMVALMSEALNIN